MIDRTVLEKVKEIAYSHENLERYSTLTRELTEDERKEFQNLLKRTEAKQKKLAGKKETYFEAIENKSIDFALVSERLQQIKDEEERNQRLVLETEERHLELPQFQEYQLTKEEYLRLKTSLAAFLEDADPTQKHQFLSNIIRRVTVHPNQLIIKHIIPIPPQRKSPGLGQDFSVISLASPRRFLSALLRTSSPLLSPGWPGDRLELKKSPGKKPGVSQD